MKISFTGHRGYDSERFGESLRRALIDLCEGQGCVSCYSGMAVGFDMAAAEAVVALRSEGYDVRLCCVIPFEGQSSVFSAEDKERYRGLISAADSCVTLAEGYRPDVYHRRNDYLVEQADVVVAFYDGESSGGTAYTVRRARRSGVEIYNICPQRQLSLF